LFAPPPPSPYFKSLGHAYRQCALWPSKGRRAAIERVAYDLLTVSLEQSPAMMDIWQNTHIAEQSLISGHFPPSGQFLFLF